MKISIHIYIVLMLISIPDYGQINIFNRAPTIDDIPNYGPVAENSVSHQVLLTGISAGGNESNQNQQLTFTAVAEKTDLVNNLFIIYSGEDEADLFFNLVPDANGKTKITVTLNDGQLFNNTTSESFEVKVYAVNGEPSFSLSSELVAVEENSGKVEIKSFATDIDDGDPELDQKLKFITSTENITGNLTFKSEPAIDKDGDLKFEVDKNTYGQAYVSIVLKDDGGTNDGGDDTSAKVYFSIKVINANNPPTINGIESPITMWEDQGEKLITLTGISPGFNEEGEVKITPFYDNSNLISKPVIDHEAGSDIADLRFSSLPNQFGEVNITIIIDDGQEQNNETSIEFLVIIKPLADAPDISNAITKTGQQTTSGLVISKNENDGPEVTHYRVTDIKNGTLYQSDGLTQINNNQFISDRQGSEGLKFTPFTGISGNGSFFIQAATDASEAALGGNKVFAQIEIINEPPEIISNPDSVVFVADEFLYEVEVTDPNNGDQLKITFIIPEDIQSWLQAKDFGDGTARLSGTPPEGYAGIYQIVVIAEDQFGDSDEQGFKLVINDLNAPPVLSPFTLKIMEDDTIFFSYETFFPFFADSDGDSIRLFKVVSEPLYGTLFNYGKKLMMGDTIELGDSSEFVYVPNRNYYGLDVFDWNLSDGTDFAQIPQRTNIIITSVFDPPEIRFFEEEPIVFEYGDKFFHVTESGEIYDNDSKNLIKAVITMSDKYIKDEDSLFYENIQGLRFMWDDVEGVLSVEGNASIADYQKLLSSLIYVNNSPLSPTREYRRIEIMLQDEDTISDSYVRWIEFGDSFENLNIIIPTGFTPNGDGINDTWYVENITRYPEFSIEVYSRSGQRIFKANNQKMAWDGRYNGELVPAGTYYYFINLSKFDRVFKGAISVLR